MNEQRNNGRGIFYGVIGVATLVVAIVGATFAYFTATASNTATITGNMATIKLALQVNKVTDVEETSGMIPLSNGMIEAAVNSPNNKACIDDNGNAVCQVYEVTLTNDSSAAQFVDGYIALKGGSGEPTDYTGYTKDTTKWPVDGLAGSGTLVGTTMRWAQVFEGTTDSNAGNSNGTLNYSTSGTQDLGGEKWYSSLGDGDIKTTGDNVVATKVGDITLNTDQAKNPTFASIDNKADGKNEANIKTANADVVTGVSIKGSDYPAITKNYIRVSNHEWNKTEGGTESFKRENDITSALVFNHRVEAGDSVTYYFVVWLTENGKDQTAGESADITGATETDKNPAAERFFAGNVTFVSAQGSEVSATFSGFARSTADLQQNG